MLVGATAMSQEVMEGGGSSGGEQRDRETLESVRSVLFKPSISLEEKRFPKIAGYDFNQELDLLSLLGSLSSSGFQASNLGDAIEIVNEMVSLVGSAYLFDLWSLC